MIFYNLIHLTQHSFPSLTLLQNHFPETLFHTLTVLHLYSDVSKVISRNNTQNTEKYSLRNLNGVTYKDCVSSWTTNIKGSNNFTKSSYGCTAINNYSSVVRKVSDDFCATIAHCTTIPFRRNNPLYMINTLSRTWTHFINILHMSLYKKKPHITPLPVTAGNIIFRCNTIYECPLYESHSMNT
jgi:hypothetical protein